MQKGFDVNFKNWMLQLIHQKNQNQKLIRMLSARLQWFDLGLVENLLFSFKQYYTTIFNNLQNQA